MFAKVFSQIFDSSIAENYQHRHIFMDLLVLADSDGVIDMTPEAIARRTNVPAKQIKDALAALCSPDTASRTPHEEGRRLLPIDPGRSWGWQIVNYHHYRKVRSEEARREYWREYKRDEREAQREKAKTKRVAGARRKPRAPLNNGEHIPGPHEIAPPGEIHSKSYDQYALALARELAIGRKEAR